MKPAAFEYERPDTLDAALSLLAEAGPAGRVIAGGQSLGPMLNLRLAQPELLVDITAILNLQIVEERYGAVWLGACVTHATIEGSVEPDSPFRVDAILSQIASGIAYRAVRNRGTIGGSLAHADPAADWMTTLTALGADTKISSSSGERWVAMSDFMTGAFETVLDASDILMGVNVPALTSTAQWGYYKFCRKAGDFADAMAAVLFDPDTDAARTVIGATNAQPIVIEGPYDADRVRDAIDAQGFDAYDRQTHLVAAKRAAMIAGLA